MKYSFGVNRKKYGEIIVENRPGITRPGMKIDKVEGYV